MATDPDGTETLTYNWSQNDPEQAPQSSTPESNWTTGPLYRSILPSSGFNPLFSKIRNCIRGSLISTWEVTPSVARNIGILH